MLIEQKFYRFAFLRLDNEELFERDYFYVITANKQKAVMMASAQGRQQFDDWSSDNYRIILWVAGEVYEPE
jgi:hypothetical protein